MRRARARASGRGRGGGVRPGPGWPSSPGRPDRPPSGSRTRSTLLCRAVRSHRPPLARLTTMARAPIFVERGATDDHQQVEDHRDIRQLPGRSRRRRESSAEGGVQEHGQRIDQVTDAPRDEKGLSSWQPKRPAPSAARGGRSRSESLPTTRARCSFSGPAVVGRPAGGSPTAGRSAWR